MKSLLCIQSYSGARNHVHLLWPSYKMSGLDILGTCPVNSTHDWPSDCKFVHNIGEEGWLTPGFLIRWVNLWKVLLSDQKYEEYDSFLVTPFDVMFLKPAPIHEGGLITHLAGFKLNYGEKANTFYHPPWWADRKSAKVIVDHGEKLISEGTWELFAPDVFLGLIIEETKLSWRDCDVYSVNGGMMKECLPNAIKAVKNGAWFVHGVVNKEQMDALSSASK